MASISASVGRGGKNVRADVTLVQQLINAKLPIPLRPLDVTGVCDPLTINAIEEIQRRLVKMSKPDGRIDPGGGTFRALTGQAAAKPVPSARFPADIIAAAKASQTATKIPASITLAQWALESGYGKSMPAGSNNPFGIKAVGSQPFVESRTREVDKQGKEYYIVAKFRKFASLSEAFELHAKLLANGSPYANARSKLPDADAFADALTGVYATDPKYGALLKSIMKSNNLKQYDS